MSSGEKTYKALKKRVAEAITLNWNPDWFDFADPIYKAFIEDVKDDIRVEPAEVPRDEKTFKLLPDAEVMLIAWLNDRGNYPEIGTPSALSDVLVELLDQCDEEEFEILLANSIAAFRRKAAKK